MTKETFAELVEHMIQKSGKTLIEKNAKYAPEDDALHNFRAGSNFDGSTIQQTIWHYMKKHMVALLDKIVRDDWEDLEDAEEKIQDSINYLLFLWCSINEKEYSPTKEEFPSEQDYILHGLWSCDTCKYENLGEFDWNTSKCTAEPCASCKANYVYGTEEYDKAPVNYKQV